VPDDDTHTVQLDAWGVAWWLRLAGAEAGVS
jgi:hypothetical protein